MSLQHKIDEMCECGSQLGIYFINGGREKRCTKCNKSFGVLLREPNSQFLMPFGKHQGKPIAELPSDYLVWGTKNLSSNSMKKRFEEELQERDSPTDITKKIISSCIDILNAKIEDINGSEEDLKIIKMAADRLKKYGIEVKIVFNQNQQGNK